ncbi:hypothetical protein [Microbacterium sp. SLBN-146]|uniref:hypothetical protein n=1 Tax=Microbacterium sp. SLBN-146 TaxID=2768457 RepID=UPI00116DF0E4|nr:hypothetical protein [Microbacterium sp. SLBN-146]TQJ31349.1 hypothetical protein FBY39_1816 [Microbacterium sp. SLBN-146]
MTEVLAEWKDFNVAIVGATATLGGLVIVAASVNIGDIVKSRGLTARLGTGIVMLVLALVVSALGLMPDLDEMWFGVLVTLASLIALVFPVQTARILATDDDRRDRARGVKAAIGFLPALTYLAAGVLGIAGLPSALAVAAVGAILAIITALVVSWVALVEVLR